MIVPPDALEIQVPGIRLRAIPVPWDTAVFGCVVAQIEDFSVTDMDLAVTAFGSVREWIDAHNVGIVSCRLPHDRLRESMFLESVGFRFVEMVLHPVIENLQSIPFENELFSIESPLLGDMPVLQEIAEKAFSHERYHSDPRIDSEVANRRYGRWVVNSLQHPQQQLLKVTLGADIIALFIVEAREDNTVYWHLTAVAASWQGRGFGSRIWRAMLHYHARQQKKAVMTTIAARNTAILNLYAKLNFRFLPPEMTLHWVQETG